MDLGPFLRSRIALTVGLALVAASGASAAVEDSAPVAVWTPFTPAAREQLAAWLATIEGPTFTVMAGPAPDRLRDALAVHPEVSLLVGYACAELEALAVGTGTPAMTSAAGLAPHPLDAAERGVFALFADPLVLAVDLDRMVRSFGQRFTDVLPRALTDVASGDFEGRFLIETATRSSASGALFGVAAIARGDRVADWLAGFGKNTEGALAATSSEAIVRLDRTEDKRFAVVRRSVLDREGGPLGVVLASDASMRGAAIYLGIAFRRDDSMARAVQSALGDVATSGPYLSAMALAEGVVSLRGPLPPAAPDWCVELRKSIDFESPRIRAEIGAIGDAVDRFETGLKDAIARRQRRFEDVYDVAGLLAVAIVLGAVVLRRKAGTQALEAPRG